jgi:acylphosphatase
VARHDDTVIRRRVVVHGQVQGVGFRWACRREAERLGVRGWVRNRADGTVEAVAEGEPDAVEGFLAWTRHGPRHAVVDRVEATEEPPEGLAGFRVAD